MAGRVIPVDPFDLVVFGGTGDLARRKLLPALYHRMCAGQVLPGTRIIATGRRDIGVDGYRALASGALQEHGRGGRTGDFLEMLDYVKIDVAGGEGWTALASRLGDDGRVRAFYLSVAPHLFIPFSERLVAAGCRTPGTRLVVEKPQGCDLASAEALNRTLASLFGERQIYRIDHYLGKETVQNLMALRFANALFEPVWNARHVDHVQITVAERIGVEGRGAYYDRTGALRDMVQNHLLQLLCLIAMEPPASFSADAVRDEKLKVLLSLAPLENPADMVCGRYLAGDGAGSYLDDVGDPGVPERELRGPACGDRQLALERDALLPAHRQETAGAHVRDRRGVQGRAAFHLSAGRRRHDSQCPGDQAAARRGDHPGSHHQGAGSGRHAPHRHAARHDLRRHP